MVWLIKAPKKVGPVTGELFRHHFMCGVALVEQQYWYRFFMSRGYKDVSPPWFPGLLSAEKPERALVVRWGGIGDVLMSTPALKKLKDEGLEVHIMMDPSRFDLLKGNPNVDHFLTCSRHHASAYTDQYDLCFDFSGIIAGNPVSELVNIYDLYEEWLGMELPRQVPEVNIPDNIRLSFEKRLESGWGVLPGDNLIVIHAEASTPVRNWPQWYTKELAFMLAHRFPNSHICVVGLNDETRKRTFFQCEVCRKRGSAIILGDMPKDPLPTKCSHCGEKLNFTKGPSRSRRKTKSRTYRQYVSIHEPSNVKYFLGSLSLTDVCCLVDMADLVIGPDSGLQHIAAAMETPSLGLFGSFDAELRLATYPLADWIQVEYQCGPCFLHHQGCPTSMRLRGTPDPLCMEMIKPESVFDRAVGLLSNNNYATVGLRIPSREVVWRICPACQSSRSDFLCRKGPFGHYRCRGCQSIFCDPLPDWDRQEKLYGNRTKYLKIYEDEGYIEACRRVAGLLTVALSRRFRFQGRVLEIGCGIGTTLAEMKRLGWEVHGIDISRDAIRKAGYRWGLKREVKVGNFLQYSPEPDELYDLIICHQTLEHFEDPFPALNKMLKVLAPDGVISITGPDADACRSEAGRWGHLNTLFTGEHLFILSKDAIDAIMDKLSLEIMSYERLKTSADFALLCCREGQKDAVR